MQPRSYDPLAYSSLSEVLAREIMLSELVPLSSIDEFYGNGVYALFYTGDFYAYHELAEVNKRAPGTFPIYIGKAGPQTMTGRDLDVTTEDASRAGKRLYDRLNDHRASIARATNLDVNDFACRILVLNALWVPLAESALIATYTPVWNCIVRGFGNHAPGKIRAAGRISKWDVLHPGRGHVTDTDYEYNGLVDDIRNEIHQRIEILGL